MTQNHPALFYLNDDSMFKKIRQFFQEGLDDDVRCVYISTQNDPHKMYEELLLSNSNSKVVKLYSYFYIPDPHDSPNEFVEKISYLKEKIFNNQFRGRIAFNVLRDTSRFFPEEISQIEDFENFLHDISNETLKVYCSFNVGIKNETTKKMIEMGMTVHDHATIENDNGSFNEIEL